MVKISIIICTFQNSFSLAKTLDSFKSVNKNNLDYEVIVIDNGSTDTTRHVVEEFIAHDKNTKYVFQKDPGLSRARNLGASIARAPFLFYTDDDITFDEYFISEYLVALTETNSRIMGGRIQLKYPSDKPDWLSPKVEYIYGTIDLGASNFPMPNTSLPLGPSFLISKDELFKLGGFDESLGLKGEKDTLTRGEETALSLKHRKRGGDIYYCGRSLVYHNVRKERLNKSWYLNRFEDMNVGWKHVSKQEKLLKRIKYFVSVMAYHIGNSFGSPKYAFYGRCKMAQFK
jgi:glycosyltransferase involved in cell wall biosynthesis